VTPRSGYLLALSTARAARGLFGLLVLALVLGACGDDEDGDTGSSPAAACAQFHDFNEATKGANPDLDAAGAKLTDAIAAAIDSDDAALAATGRQLQRTLGGNDTAAFATALVDFGERCDELGLGD
jgi:hypothetical protein